MGTDDYGVYTLVMSMLGIIWILDLGLSVPVTKFVAEFEAKKQSEQADEIISATLLLLSLIGVFAFVILYFTAEIIAGMFADTDVEQMVPAIRLAALAIALQFPCIVLGAVIMGRQNFGLLSRISIFVETIRTATILLVLYLGYGLLAVMWVGVAIAILSLGVYIHLCRTRYSYRLVPAYNRRAREVLLGFSLQITLSTLARTLRFRADRILLGFFAGVRDVAYYGACITPALLLLRLNALIVSVTLPIASEQDALSAEEPSRESADRLRTLVTEGTRRALIIAMLITSPLIILTDSILMLWLDAEFADRGGIALQLFAAATFFELFQRIGTTTLVGMGQTNVELKYQGSLALASLALYFVLIPHLGIYGASLALALPIALISPLTVNAVRKTLRLGSGYVIRCVAAPVMVATIVTGSGLYLNLSAGNVLELLLFTAIINTCLLAGLLVTGAIDRSDWTAVMSLLRAERP